MQKMAQIGIAGLAVMGENLVLNMADKGFSVAVYNRTTAKVDAFLAGRAQGKTISGRHTVKDFVAAIERPRKIMMMLRAGEAVDQFIEQLLPYLQAGDIVIDGGNSNYHDTIRRARALEAKGLLFIGTGVSGGEEGALKGPSIMPGGSAAAWPHLEKIFTAIAAKAEDKEPCCAWMGSDGAGHFVKMVHNGIEYGDMQLICETYDLMKRGLGLSNDRMHEVFSAWNKGPLDSYLIEITRDILAYRAEDGSAVVDVILDAAGQKGTGKWTVGAALDDGMPLTLIGEAVFARCLSALKDERAAAAKVIRPSLPVFAGDVDAFVEDLRQALYASKIISYAQGYQLLKAAARTHHWNLNFGGIALTWRGGCIIRSAFLGDIKKAFDRNPALGNLLLDPFFSKIIETHQAAWRRVIVGAVQLGIPVPCLSSALAYLDGYRSERLPANLLQAQRDYFGAHNYERVDRPRGEMFHTNWTGRGGTTTSQAYGV